MGGCCSNVRSVGLRDTQPALSETQALSVAQRAPTLMSPMVLFHLISLDTALGGDCLASRESFQNIQVNLSIIWALLCGVAAVVMEVERPDHTVYGSLSFLGTILCFCFLCFLTATLHSLFFIIMTVSIPDDEEFSHWIRCLGPMPVKIPVYLGCAGIFALLYCIAENMTVHYDLNYTGICLLKCSILVLCPMFYIPYKMTWAKLLTDETATEINDGKNCPATVEGIRDVLVNEYLERDLKGDVMKLNKHEFLVRLGKVEDRGEFFMELAGRIYEEFKQSKLDEMLGIHREEGFHKEPAGVVVPLASSLIGQNLQERHRRS